MRFIASNSNLTQNQDKLSTPSTINISVSITREYNFSKWYSFRNTCFWKQRKDFCHINLLCLQDLACLFGFSRILFLLQMTTSKHRKNIKILFVFWKQNNIIQNDRHNQSNNFYCKKYHHFKPTNDQYSYYKEISQMSQISLQIIPLVSTLGWQWSFQKVFTKWIAFFRNTFSLSVLVIVNGVVKSAHFFSFFVVTLKPNNLYLWACFGHVTSITSVVTICFFRKQRLLWFGKKILVNWKSRAQSFETLHNYLYLAWLSCD